MKKWYIWWKRINNIQLTKKLKNIFLNKEKRREWVKWKMKKKKIAVMDIAHGGNTRQMRFYQKKEVIFSR